MSKLLENIDAAVSTFPPSELSLSGSPPLALPCQSWNNALSTMGPLFAAANMFYWCSSCSAISPGAWKSCCFRLWPSCAGAKLYDVQFRTLEHSAVKYSVQQ